jgi:hypothetical protein
MDIKRGDYVQVHWPGLMDPELAWVQSLDFDPLFGMTYAEITSTKNPRRKNKSVNRKGVTIIHPFHLRVVRRKGD